MPRPGFDLFFQALFGPAWHMVRPNLDGFSCRARTVMHLFDGGSGLVDCRRLSILSEVS